MGRTLFLDCIRTPARYTSEWGLFILLICLTRESKPYTEDEGMEAPLFFLCLTKLLTAPIEPKGENSISMDKISFPNDEIRNKLLEVITNLKDEYAPNSANCAIILKDIVDAIENDTLTNEHLRKLKDCENYSHIMNLLRTARINFDLTKFSD